METKTYHKSPEYLRASIKSEFSRLQLATKVKVIGAIACVEIFQTEANIQLSHDALALLNLLQMYERKS